MNYRIVLGVGVATLALLITGLALGSDSDIDPSAIDSTTPTEPVPVAPNAPDLSPIPLGAVRILEGSSLPFKVGDAGTVIVGRVGDLLTIVSAEPQTGWTAEIRVPSGPEVGGVIRK